MLAFFPSLGCWIDVTGSLSSRQTVNHTPGSVWLAREYEEDGFTGKNKFSRLIMPQWQADMLRDAFSRNNPRREGWTISEWRAKDDDGNIVAVGFILRRNDLVGSETDFGPQDYYEADSGATSIEYRNGNRWEVL